MTDNLIRVRNWLSNDALPLWATVGVDHEQGGFVERLLFNGDADHAAAKRTRVQARQIYVYSHAHLLNLYDGADEIASLGYDFLVRHACPDGAINGFVHSLDRAGNVRDPKRDTYDHAFVLFALSWYYRATGRAEVRPLLDDVASLIDRQLRHPSGRGFSLDHHGGPELDQNPHMHLLEAMLAAHEATGDERFLDRATEIFNLFEAAMFDQVARVLREHHTESWSPAPGLRGEIVEPGHHCEWVWLLKRYADASGKPLSPLAIELYDFVEKYGRPDGVILLCDQLDSRGGPIKLSTRSWPQTEALKAEIALAELGGHEPGMRAEHIIDSLFQHFLDRPVRGGWVDWIDQDQTPLVSTIPASTFYHLFLAFSEYCRVREHTA